MAEKCEGATFLHELNQVTKNGKCLKSFLDSSNVQAVVLFNEEFMNYCLNSGKKLEKYEHQKLIQEANGPGFNEEYVSLRDEILYNLNVLCEIFSFSKSKHSVCPSVLKFVMTICKHNGCLFRILKSYLNSHDHFIAFQSYKVCCHVYQISPILVTCTWIDELIVLLLSEHNKNIGPWLHIYTAQLIKSLIIDLGSVDIWKSLSKTLDSVCGCLLDEKSRYEIHNNDIKSSLSCHWLNLTNHYIAKLLNGDLCAFSFSTVLQVLTTMLSCGKTFIETWGSILANQKLHAMNTGEGICDKTINSLNMAFPIGEIFPSGPSLCENHQHILKLQNDCQLCENSQGSSAPVFMLKSFKKVVMQLVEINHEKCLLSFNQAVFKFLNYVVDSVLDSCLLEQIQITLQICSILVKHSSKLLESIPQVTGKVHFGGQVTCAKTSSNCDQLFDEVSLRKVLLLVLRSVLAMLQRHNDPSSIIQWQDLKTSLESWFSFVIELSQSVFQSFATWLIQLFAEQDDELVCLLFSLLQLYQALFSIKRLQPSSLWTSNFCDSINPHVFFMKFLTSINYDHSLMLDFLVSNETHFLLYFHNYLRHLANDWQGFIDSVKQRQDLCEEIRLQEVDYRRLGCSLVNLTSNDVSYNHVGNEGDVGFCNNADNECNDGGTKDFDTWCDASVGDDASDISNEVGNGDASSKDGSGDGIGVKIESNSEHPDDVGNCDRDATCKEGNVDNIDDKFETACGCGNYDGFDTCFKTFLNGYDMCSCIVDGVLDEILGDVTSGKDSHAGDSADGFEEIATDCDGTADDVIIMISSDKHLQQILTCIIRLRYSIERMSSKGLFPYPATALTKIIKYIETLYEGERAI